jgi:hypothetical protein
MAALSFTSLLAGLMTIAQRHSHGYQQRTSQPLIKSQESNILDHPKQWNSTV